MSIFLTETAFGLFVGLLTFIVGVTISEATQNEEKVLLAGLVSSALVVPALTGGLTLFLASQRVTFHS